MVLTHDEVRRVFAQLAGDRAWSWGFSMAAACVFRGRCEIRVKDLDLERRELVVRNGKGGKDRVTVDPRWAGSAALKLSCRCAFCHGSSASAAWALRGVAVPDALKAKYPSAPTSLGWQWLFPSHSLSPRSLRWWHPSAITCIPARCSER